MKRIISLVVLASFTACGTQQSALQGAKGEVWQVAAAQNAGSFGLLVADGQIVGIQDQGGVREIEPDIPFSLAGTQLLIGFQVEADVFGHGATQPTYISVVAQRMPDGTFRGVLSIDTNDSNTIEFVKECTVKRVS
jgi:hypothetical protein